MKQLLLLLLLGLSSFGQVKPNPPGYELPQAPSSSKIENRIFWITHGIFLPASVVYDVEVTHQGLAHHKCIEGNPILRGHPSRGQLYLLDGGAALGEFGLDYLLHRAHLKYVDNVSAVIGGVFHFQAGSTWFTHGCY